MTTAKARPHVAATRRLCSGSIAHDASEPVPSCAIVRLGTCVIVGAAANAICGTQKNRNLQIMMPVIIMMTGGHGESGSRSQPEPGLKGVDTGGPGSRRAAAAVAAPRLWSMPVAR